MSKAREYHKQKMHTKRPKVHRAYTTTASTHLQNRGATKNNALLTTSPTKSTKSTTDGGLKTKNNLDQVQILQRNVLVYE